ncbi:MAG TPA: MarR family transcriptional regulator [Solirubrobacteraceae bacterium]|jgi:DNA-binding IclR family transcriptional regulator|nr:MarR family transcriptional regulator [Solirubrobacteraceae bacterium]
MPTSFLRGLELLETIDVHGPVTVTELARLTGHDKSTVSRTLTACEPDGWIVRDHGRVALGPRAALLAYASTAGELIRRAQPLVEALAGVTGLTAQAYALVGTRATVVAAAGGSGNPLMSVGVGMSTSLVATAAGQVIATHIDPAKLERLLPAEPFPNALAELLANPGYVAFASGRFARSSVVAELPLAVPRDRPEFDARLALVREQGYAIDHGDLHPEIGCIAVPWLGGADGAALTCMGLPSEIAAAEKLALRVLNAAVAPAATREDVVAAAASARHYSLAP